MDLNERIKAAAIAIDASVFERVPGHERGKCGHCDDCEDVVTLRAIRAVQAAFPELFTDPPTAWVAPWEADDPMIGAGEDAYLKCDRRVVDLDYALGRAFSAMRDSHLSTLKGEK